MKIIEVWTSIISTEPRKAARVYLRTACETLLLSLVTASWSPFAPPSNVRRRSLHCGLSRTKSGVMASTRRDSSSSRVRRESTRRLGEATMARFFHRFAGSSPKLESSSGVSLGCVLYQTGSSRQAYTL